MVKRLFAGVIVGFFSFSLQAQNIEGVNARLDGMAGSGATDDIGWTINHPASIYQYANSFQGTICTSPIPGVGESFGIIIGIARITNSLYAGFTLNNRMTMPLNFYKDAYLYMAPPHLMFDETMKNMVNLPNLNICYKLSDEIVLGVQGFFEEASESRSEDPGAGFTKDEDFNVRCDGAAFEARLQIGGLTLVPQAKIGFPRIDGAIKRTDAPLRHTSLVAPARAPAVVVDSNTTYHSKGNLMVCGANAWGELGKTLLIGGVWATNKSWQFSRDEIIGTAASVTSSGPSHTRNVIECWFAIVPYFSDGFYISPEYNGGIEQSLNRGPQDADPDSTQYFMYNNFRLGMEKITKNYWIFDEIGLRCGMVAYWNTELRTIKNSEQVNSETTEKLPWKSFFWGADFLDRQAKVCFGFTLKKGRGTLDVSFNMKNWKGMGTLSGPPPALATLTVDFGPKK